MNLKLFNEPNAIDYDLPLLGWLVFPYLSLPYYSMYALLVDRFVHFPCANLDRLLRIDTPQTSKGQVEILFQSLQTNKTIDQREAWKLWQLLRSDIRGLDPASICNVIET